LANDSIPLRDIAEVIGRRLNVPAASKPADHFGFIGPFIAIDNPTSNRSTQEWLVWRPTQPGLIPNLEHARAFEALTDRAKSSPMSASPAPTNRRASSALNAIGIYKSDSLQQIGRSLLARSQVPIRIGPCAIS
jgi:hypothetical protein